MKILSENNTFQDFDGISITERSDIIELFFENEEWLELTSDHRVYCKDGIKLAKDIKVGDYVITKTGITEVIYKSKHNRLIKVFDAINVKNTHNFYANSILTHNCDEMAFVQNDVEFYTSTYPVITSGTKTKVIITSTPNGMNLFYKLYSDAINGKNEFKAIKYTWRDHPLRDENWKKETIRNTSEKQFRQEHEVEFLGSSNTLISGDCLERLVYKNPIFSDDYSYLYEKPKPDHTYVGFVDVGEGAGRDFSVVNVIDITQKPYKQVYVYKRNDISPWLFPPIIMNIVQKYNNAYLQVENNSVGKIVADIIFNEYDYDNLISSNIFKGEERLSGYSTRGIGVQMNKKTKVIGCSAIKTIIEENILEICDWNTIQELSWFVKGTSSYEAEKGKTDDIVMTLVHFGWLTTQNFFEDLSKPGMQDFIKSLLENDESSIAVSFGFFSDGTELYE